MEEKVIIYKNRIEVKILNVIYGIIFIPVSILLIIYSIKDPEMLYLFLLVFTFLFILYIINRFKIVFDYKNRVIRYTGYISRAKTYKFDDIIVYYGRGNTTLPNDYVYFFIWRNHLIFKISSIDFIGQTKESIDYLNLLFSDNQKYVFEMEKKIKIKDGYLEVISYELDEDMVVAYLPNGINID